MTLPLDAWAIAATEALIHSAEDKGAPEKPAQIQMIAASVTQAAREQRGFPFSKQRLVAAQLAIIENETHGSLRIHRNECNLKKRECDAGRAISPFQLHAVALSSPEIWPSLGFMTFESTLLAAKEATRIFVRSYGYCRAQKASGDPIALAFTAYAGRGCQLEKWQGWRPRMATYERLLRVPVPKQKTDDGQKQPS